MSKASTVVDQMIGDSTVNSHHVDIDNSFGGQCWDLVELFAEKLGIPKATTPRPWAIPLGTNGYAKEAWTEFDGNPHMQQYFDKVPAGQQQKGDIVVFDGHGSYIEGHIAISLGGTAVFEENADPDGSPAHVFNNRSSTYLLGALRFKEEAEMSDTTVDDIYKHMDQTNRSLDALRDDHNKKMDDIYKHMNQTNESLTQAQIDIKNVNEMLDKINKTLVEVEKSIDKLNK